jgi:hypothetical protein
VGYLRFHRSAKLLPGVRLNMAKTGPSISLGVPGAHFNVGVNGTRTTVGVPGTGLSYIERKGFTANDAGSKPSPNIVVRGIAEMFVAAILISVVATVVAVPTDNYGLMFAIIGIGCLIALPIILLNIWRRVVIEVEASE